MSYLKGFEQSELVRAATAEVQARRAASEGRIEEARGLYATAAKLYGSVGEYRAQGKAEAAAVAC